MSNILNILLRKRKEYRIGSRPIDSVVASTSKAQNFEIENARYPPMTSITEMMYGLPKAINKIEQTPSSSSKTNESPARNGNFVKRMVAAFERKCKNNGRRNSRRTTPKSKKSCVVANEEFFIKQTPMNKTFIIKPRCRSVDRLPHASEQSPFFQDEDPSEIVDLTFEIDEEQPSERKITFSRKNDQVDKASEKNSITSCGKSDLRKKREKSPKIVGAFLKKPIEVEETKIDWIPITNQRLPRNHSFQKIMSLLLGKKYANKSSQFYCSVNPTNEKVRRHRDSGDDEKTSSGSSPGSSKTCQNGTSVCQNTKPTNQQKNIQVSTFQSQSSTSKKPDKFEEDDYPTLQDLAKKLMLKEVPRSEVRLSLGPLFPTQARADKFVCQEATVNENEEENVSYESEEINQSLLLLPLPKHPFITPLPKHPFVSESSINREPSDSIMSSEQFRQIDMRQMLSLKYPSSEIIHDVPRNPWSISSPDIGPKDKHSNNDDSYVLPPLRIPVRRKSCILEDAISLKRRSVDLESALVVKSNFYACPDENQFATVKPRNNKVSPSQELLRSMTDDDNYQLQSPYFVNRRSDFNRVF
ncbi:uncharacterized protein [Chelonus insularis]|uniref:uncharacterized protein n=1 Tax=Chelonus insularis TaxID=460826 RepID=UPI00158C2F7E|nr:uncharacterized protein LOC118070849 [Chelonus insularis]